MSCPSWLRAEAPVPAQLSSQAAPAPASAVDETLEQRILALLTAGIEKQPSRKALLALGPDVSRALIAVFEDEAAPRHARLRALSLLGSVADEPALAYLLQLAKDERPSNVRAGSLDPARSPTALRRVLEALSQVQAPPPAGNAAQKNRARTAETARIAEKHLAHDDAQVRKWAVRLLVLDPSKDVTRSLQLQQEREASPLVRDALSAALKGRLAPRVAPPQGAPKTDSPPR